MDVAEVICEGHDGVEPLVIYDRDHCSLVSKNPQLRPIQKNKWDTYRDLNKVLASDLCQEQKINQENICIFDNDVEKV